MHKEINSDCDSQPIEDSSKSRSGTVLPGMEKAAAVAGASDRQGFCKRGLEASLRILEAAQRFLDLTGNSGELTRRETSLVGVNELLIQQIKELHSFIEIDGRELAMAHDTIESLQKEIVRMDAARERLLEKCGGVDL